MVGRLRLLAASSQVLLRSTVPALLMVSICTIDFRTTPAGTGAANSTRHTSQASQLTGVFLSDTGLSALAPCCPISGGSVFASASTDASATRSLLVTVSDSVPMRAVSKSSVSQLKVFKQCHFSL